VTWIFPRQGCKNPQWKLATVLSVYCVTFKGVLKLCMASNNSISEGVDLVVKAENASPQGHTEAQKWPRNSRETIDNVYDPLQLKNQEIRLVTLGPAPSVNAPPVCRLKVVKLSTQPVFEALSWAWGDARRTQPMTLQGKVWHAPENLVSALKSLRAVNKSKTLWVDALSINQSTEPAALIERGQQVRLMKYIFSMASHVIIWMGTPEGDLAEFLIKYAFQNQSMEEAARHDPITTTIMLSELLELPWWQRLWVIQECALGLIVSMNFGCEAIEFRHFLNDLYKTIGILLNARDSDYDYAARKLMDTAASIFMKLMNRNDYWDNLAAYHRQQIRSGNPLFDGNELTQWPAAESKSVHQFIDLLSQCRHQLTSDPRDRIYALLGLADDAISAELDPRYEETIVQTFVRTTERLITLQRSLYVLSQASGQETSGVENLPSWVPHWNAPAESREEWLAITQMRSFVEASFTACSDTDAVVTLLTGNVLKLKAIWVDVITSVSFEANHRQLFSARLGSSRNSNDGVRFMKDELEKAITGNRLIFIAQSGLIGIGPRNIKVGDCLFVLAGGKLPFVLRKWRTKYLTLVGQCCVPGLMHGEATESGFQSMRRRNPEFRATNSSDRVPQDNWEDIYLE
jgi:hypothetical protein